MIHKMFGWSVLLSVVVSCGVAVSGWSGASEEAPTSEIAALEQLADGILEEEGRLWVITAQTADGMLRWTTHDAAEAAAWLEESSSGVPWYINVQGELADQRELHSVWGLLEERTGGEIIERYEEPRTYSYSYSSPRFLHTLRSGDADIAFQAAAHLDTETGAWRVTLGTPAILIEY